MKENTVKILKESLGSTLDKKVIENLIEIPPEKSLGDFAFPCFSLAKEMKKSPVEIAKDLADKISKKIPLEFEKVIANGPYLNFFVNREKFSLKLIEKILKEKEEFGKENFGKGKKIGIEFSQPNTHKAFHVGHIRGTSLGESLARISEQVGFKVFRLNYSGDTGMHIAKWIWCYQNFHNKEKLVDDEAWIAGIYVDAVKRLEENPEAQSEVDIINNKIETKEDKEINELWEKTRELSIKSWDKIYKELGTHFDKHYFEGEVELEGKEISQELYEKGIAKKDDAIFMDLKDYNLGVWVLLRRDGTVLYSAKDLALAKKKVKEFPAERYLVTVGDEQKMHFEQLQKTLELMNFEKAKEYDFLPFGMVRFPEGKMSSRTGQNILYSDFSNEVKKLAKEGLEKRGEKGNEINKRALTIAISAIKYSMLKQDPRKTIIFDSKKSVSFEGNTGPYLLYSYARAKSILRKVKNKQELELKNLEEKEYELVSYLNDFKKIIQRSYRELNPSFIANYAYELCQKFNEFYHACPVINSENEGFRLNLVESFSIILKNSLNLLGIEVLEKM